MKEISILFKIFSILGFIGSVICISELELFIAILLSSLILLAIGVLFKNLAGAFEDIALIRRRQKLELIRKGVINDEE